MQVPFDQAAIPDIEVTSGSYVTVNHDVFINLDIIIGVKITD